MPKRTFGALNPTAMDSERIQKKTERSHEENQERAYIAASRRADRSIEARVQSARMASEIHRKRTGKGFKVSEEIVLKEEMYEEEDDDLPRQYRALAAHLRTSSEDMNSRLNAYITNQVAMRTLARHQEVNRRFSESFPTLTHMSRNLAQSAYFQPLQDGPAGPAQPQPPLRHNRSNSIPHRRLSVPHHQPLSPAHLSVSADDQLSTPALTPTSGSSDTPLSSHSPSTFIPAQPYQATTAAPPSTLSSELVDPALAPVDDLPQNSSFTAELPPETKFLANIDMSDPLAGAFYGMPGDNMAGAAAMGAPPHFDQSIPIADPAATYAMKDQMMPATDGGFFAAGLQLPNRFPGQESRIGTPGGGEGDSWDTWVNTEELGKLDAF